VHLDGFTIEIYHDARSHERQITHSGVYKAKLKYFILEKSTCRSTAVQREYIIASPLKRWLRERAITTRYTCTVYIVRKPKH